LLVTKLDRLTRRVQDLGTLIEDYFEQRYALMSVTDQIDIRTANGRLVLNILMSFSQWEREAIQERTREAMAYKRQNGERTGGDVPYGYRAINGKLVQDPDEQAMLALIHRYRVQGLSIRAIVAELDRLGHRTRKGTPFQPTQIVRMLKHQEGA
jgi:DNA invertase Pin-like site-specific DNA recombinase